MRTIRTTKHQYSIIALLIICGVAALPLLASADDGFSGGDFFGTDAGGFFGGDIGGLSSDLNDGGDVGGIFGTDAGGVFELSNADARFTSGTDIGGVSGTDVGIAAENDVGGVELSANVGGAAFEDSGGLFSFDNGFGVGGITAFGFGGVSGFETVPIFPASLETFSGSPAELTGGAQPFDSGPAIIAESAFESLPAASEAFFAAAEPVPFLFAGSEPLGIVTVSHAIRPAASSRSIVTLSQIPYTGVGSNFASALFILAVLALSGAAAYFLARTRRTHRQEPSGWLNPVRPQAPKTIRPVFAGW